MQTYTRFALYHGETLVEMCELDLTNRTPLQRGRWVRVWLARLFNAAESRGIKATELSLRVCVGSVWEN